MSNDKNNSTSISKVTPSQLPVGSVVPVALASSIPGVVGPQTATPGKPAPQVSELSLSNAQFERLARILVYASIATGIVFNKPNTTASPANLSNIKALGDAVLELAK